MCKFCYHLCNPWFPVWALELGEVPKIMMKCKNTRQKGRSFFFFFFFGPHGPGIYWKWVQWADIWWMRPLDEWDFDQNLSFLHLTFTKCKLLRLHLTNVSGTRLSRTYSERHPFVEQCEFHHNLGNFSKINLHTVNDPPPPTTKKKKKKKKIPKNKSLFP